MDIQAIRDVVLKGFITDEEAIALYETARMAAVFGPCLEIGSYCGLSSACLGVGCREAGGILFSIDHHRGSEEQQPGEAYFDPDLLDPNTGGIDTLPHFLRTIRSLCLEETVIPIISRSTPVARFWRTPLGLIFIDGGHTFAAAFSDYNGWVSHLLPGGYLLIHDLFPTAARGGLAPHCIHRLAVASGLFEEIRTVGTLGILKRCHPGATTGAAAQSWRRLQGGAEGD
jgi:MMP 1-O-methyltransferase